MAFPFKIDQTVAQRKFDAEVSALRFHRDVLRKRGWLIRFSDYPYLMVEFADLRDPLRLSILAILMNYENYNIEPPSVSFLNPATYEPINRAPNNWQGVVNDHFETRQPFLCLPGVREFHSHPEHDNRPWDLYRYSGHGRPFELVDTLWERCIKPFFTKNSHN